MALFGFLKKKQEELPMPPPPTPPEMIPLLQGDIEEIRAPETHIEPPLPELPPALPAPTPMPVEEKEVLEEPSIITRPSIKPTFVAMEDYKRIINDTNAIRAKVMEAENFVRKLSDLKNEEEKAFEKWKTQLEDVEKKLSYVDQLIAKAER